MIVYTYSETRQKLAALLDQAEQEGEVLIRRKDGRVFVIRPQEMEGSPLDVAGIDLDLTVPEILDFIREGRREA